jgi:16S rRNA (cytosine967-C5)-methyltransferase
VSRSGRSTSPREAAWRALCDYDARHPPWEPLLNRTLKGLEGPDRTLASALLTGTLRHRRWIDYALEASEFDESETLEMPVRNLIRLGAFQLLVLDRMPHHAAVSEPVDLAKRFHPRAAGLINAALRAVQRRMAGRASAAPEPALAVKRSFPDETVAVAESLLPEEEWDHALAMMNDPGPLGLRCNTLRAPAQQTLARVGERLGEEPCPHPLVEDARTCDRASLEALRPLLDEGVLVIQDPASQLIGHLASPRPGQRIVDLCAAPGGKSAHLAALMGNEGTVIATDRDRVRLRVMRANLERLGATCVEVTDWGMAEMLMAAPEPDAIVVDAPCSGWGTVRHKPDLKWRSRDVDALADMQRTLLAEAAPHLASGGALIYSVCTFLPEETTEVVNLFLADHTGFTIQDARDVLPESSHATVTAEGFVWTWPHRHQCDGFFAARLMKA